jgi:DNA-binding response OmpR family regulator
MEVERSLPDLIVLDVMMPGRDGFDVLEQLKARPRTAVIPVVLLTAKAADADVWEGWKSGADYYMTKPFDPGELARFAHQVLGTGDGL